MSQGEEALLAARALISHLQAIDENHKTDQARELHDVIASLMVAATMDLAAVGLFLPDNEQARFRLARAQRALQGAIDHSRHMVDQLRPTILDTLGLFAALRWRVKMARRETRVVFTESYAEPEPDLPPDAAIALFRIAQEGLAMTFKRGDVTVADLQVRIENGRLRMELFDNGIPECLDRAEKGAAVALGSMRHRIELLGGTVAMTREPGNGTWLTAILPLHMTRPK